MPCNCGKGKSVNSTSSNFKQGSSNIKRLPVRAPASNQNNVTAHGQPVIKRSVRALPQGVTRYTKSATMARVLNR